MTEYAPVQPGQKQLGLVIDLDTCVGCHACVTACKSWNTSGHPGPLADIDPYGAAPDGAWLNRVHSFEAGEERVRPHGALPPLLPALRRARLRHRLPDRRLLQARRGRHRAGQRRPVHRLRPVRLGLPLRRARARPGPAHDEEMHALRRPDRQPEPARGRAPAGLRHGLPDPGAPFRRSRRPRLRRLAARRRARRRRPAARAGLPPDQQIPAAARARSTRRTADDRAEPEHTGAPRPTACSAGSTAPSAPELHAPSLFGDPVHHDLRRRLRPAGGARPACCCSGWRRGPWLLAAALAARAWRWPRSVSSPRPSISAAPSAPGAPSRSGARPGCRAKGWRPWRSTPRPCRWRGSCCRATRAAGRRASLAAATAALALATVVCTAMIYASLKPVRQWRHPGRPGGLPAARPRHRSALLWRLFRLAGADAPAPALAGAAGPARRVARQGALLARRRRPHAGLTAGRGHRPRPFRHGAAAGCAAHREQLPAARDGLPGGAPACREAASARPPAGFALPAALAAALFLPRCRRPCAPALPCWPPPARWWARWSSAGCSSPRPATRSRSTTAPVTA